MEVYQHKAVNFIILRVTRPSILLVGKENHCTLKHHILENLAMMAGYIPCIDIGLESMNSIQIFLKRPYCVPRVLNAGKLACHLHFKPRGFYWIILTSSELLLEAATSCIVKAWAEKV